MSETRLIVNADDLGWTPGVNDGIFTSHLEGVVSSATLMVNGPGAEHAAEELERPDLANLGVGLHVQLSSRGRTTLPPAEISTLVDAEGRLPPRPEDLENADPSEIRAEIRAQFARFQSLLGRLPSHLDGHHHVHRRPVVSDAVIELAVEHGLPVRNVSPEIGRRLRSAGVPTTDRFDESFYRPDVSFEHFFGLLRDLEPGITEIMCHPGMIDAGLRATSSYVDERETEIAILTDPRLGRWLATEDVRLVSFRSL